MYWTLPVYKSYPLIVWIPSTALTIAPNGVGMSAEKEMKLTKRIKEQSNQSHENKCILGLQSIEEQIIMEK